ncbi:MAG TPA: efflux transporter outer membrane subunit, partial [Verrucomicrobiae bacterium]|nr:efflux transporter outer membrane subunit [Verrucomicrobiae bacterium]
MRDSAMSLPAWCLGVLVVALGFFAGCAVGPDYKRPQVNAPPAFRGEQPNGTNSFADLPWWEIFHDETLQGLIRTALTNNYDLRVAFTRITQAQAVTAETRAALFPQLNYSGLAGVGKNVAPGGSSPFPTGGTNARLYELYGTAAWEIDVFGRVRRMTESARAQYFATQEARRDVITSLIAQVAQDYFQLLTLDRELAIAQDETNAYAGSYKIFSQRLQQGAASKLETSSAEALFNSAAATIPDLQRQIAQQENLISVLLGENPRAVPHDGSQLDNQFPPDVPAGLPASLLQRRADIREAEQQLRSANAQVGVAKANFFPELSLTGLFGHVSPELATFTSGRAAAWGAAANLTGPIFQGGRLRAQYRQALAARDQYALQYQSTVLNAFQEVSSALIAREKLAEARVLHARAVEAYKEAVRIVNQRYTLGQSSYYEVLQEEQLLYPEENLLVQTEFNQLSAIVQLYRALGGGWQAVEQANRSKKN